MKNVKYVMLLFLVVNFSCFESNENLNDFLLEGKVVDDVTNEPVANIEIDYEVCDVIPGSIFYRCSKKDEGKVLTDSNGEFSVVINYEERDNDLKFYTHSKNDKYDATSFQYRYEIETLMNEDLPVLKVSRLAPVKIRVKNTNPFNEEDHIEFVNYRGEVDSGYYNLVSKTITNYENQNVIYDDGVTYSSALEWKGKSVNSLVEGKLSGGYKKVYIEYVVVKNGVRERRKTEAITLNPNSVNEYLIEY
ncbi:conserved hypothetical protein [Tenacibaculum sp. 190524A05c]|uniref:hypothetical protein n=1 Tax=Tenacibaculum platacis TaxID=3137852 RepID=UPI0031FA7B3A